VNYRLLGEHLPGTLAELVTVPAQNVVRGPNLSPALTWPEAAAFSLVTLTAWRMVVTRAQRQPGETVLIWGIGGGVSMTAPNNRERILPRLIDDEIKESFINYSMSVIVSRALPDVRDGLKPVHRRVLYAMNELGLVPGRPYKKSATVVGDVLGKYHPHGDSAVYDALVRMVQDFSLRYPLIDGQGNFGSVDGDPAAAYRYTEARLTRVAMEMLADIDKNTVDFVPNFDDRLQEPTVLPAASRTCRQRLVGHRGRHGDEHPAAQSREVVARSSHLIDNPEMTPIAISGSSSRAPTSRRAATSTAARASRITGDGPRPHRHARPRGDRGEGVLEQVADRRHRASRIRSTRRS
jgi:hypothetical protein